MQIKSMAIQSMDDSGKGLALLARLPEVDSDGDTYQRGAFAWKDDGHQWASMITAHDRRKMPFGKARVYEEGDNAYAELHLNLKTTTGREWHEALLFDFATGTPVQEWSFGYNALDAEYRIKGDSRIRVLKKLDIDEVSPVLRGAGNGTRTLAIKGAKLHEAKFAALIADLGEMAGAIDSDPAAISATGLKQLREIQDAIGRVFTGDEAAQAKAMLATDTALGHMLRHQVRAHLPRG